MSNYILKCIYADNDADEFKDVNFTSFEEAKKEAEHRLKKIESDSRNFWRDLSVGVTPEEHLGALSGEEGDEILWNGEVFDTEDGYTLLEISIVKA